VIIAEVPSATTYELVSRLMTPTASDHEREAAFREIVARPITV